MYCHRCGTPNADQAATCTNCGTALVSSDAPQPTPPQPPVTESGPYQAGPPPGQGQGWYQGGYQGGPGGPMPRVPNYLVQSILVTLFCCIPLGVVAIVFAAQVNTKVAQGDLPGAMEASRKAKMFCWISFGIGVVGMVIWSAFMAATLIGSGEF